MHLFQCSDPLLREKLQEGILQEGIDDLEDAIRLRHAPSAMWTALRRGIQSFCLETNPMAYTPAPRYAEAYHSQTQIGWDQFLKGRVSSKWGLLMAGVYAANPQLRRLESRRRFVRTLVDHIWRIYDKLWSHRCSKLHDDSDIDSLQVSELDRRVRFLFAHRTKLFDGGDYDRFHLGVENTLALPPAQKRAWLTTLAHRCTATKLARTKLHKSIKPITTYFPKLNPDDDP